MTRGTDAACSPGFRYPFLARDRVSVVGDGGQVDHQHPLGADRAAVIPLT